MSEQPEKPCPSHVVVGVEHVYCEQGPAGHEGTCCGDRDEREYRRLLAWYKRSKGMAR